LYKSHSIKPENGKKNFIIPTTISEKQYSSDVNGCNSSKTPDNATVR